MLFRKKRVVTIAFFVAIFVFLFSFFRFVTPVTVFDTDDWTYIAYSRDAFPTTREWNPTRILPEIVMPVLGFIAAFVVTPLTGDYLGAVNTVFVTGIALGIIAYLATFAWAMKKAFHLSQISTMATTLLFLVAHFWAFRSENVGNMYLLYAKDLTCYFYYTLPTIFNGMLVILLEERPHLWEEAGPIQKGFLVLAVYLAVCSNMFCSIVIAVYCGIVSLFRIVVKALVKKSWNTFCTAMIENRFYVATLGWWLISLVFEVSGARAESVGLNGKISGIKQTMRYFGDVLQSTNVLFQGFCIGVILLTVICLFVQYRQKKQNEDDYNVIRKMLLFMLAAAIVAIYQILLCGVTGLSYYMLSGDVLISVYFYIFAAVFAAMGYLMWKVPRCQVAIPLLICVAIFNCNTFWNTYQTPGHYKTSNSEAVIQISEDIYRQIIEGNAKKKDTLEICVPDYREEGNENNWPLTTSYLGERLARTLYKHGQIDSLMEIRIIPDSRLNDFYHID